MMGKLSAQEGPVLFVDTGSCKFGYVVLTSQHSIVCSYASTHNMQLSESKGQCKSILFTLNRKDRAPIVRLNDEVVCTVDNETSLPKDDE